MINLIKWALPDPEGGSAKMVLSIDAEPEKDIYYDEIHSLLDEVKKQFEKPVYRIADKGKVSAAGDPKKQHACKCGAVFKTPITRTRQGCMVTKCCPVCGIDI